MIERSGKMRNDKRCRNLIWILESLLFCVTIIIVKKTGIIFIPDDEKMVEFQFEMITVSTVFAGFSFTVLGMLLGMFSEPMMIKLKDTGIVTRKSKKLMRSAIYFCASGIISLLFIVKCNQYIISCFPKAKSVVEYLFISCIFLLLLGIIDFAFSTFGVFQLITKVYGYDEHQYQVKRKEYKEEIKKAEERLNN